MSKYKINPFTLELDESQASVCLAANVENSDSSYSSAVASGGSLILPDSDVEVNSNLEGQVVSVKTIDIQLTDGVSSVTPNSVNIVGNTVNIEVPAGGTSISTATLMKTGQTTSYRTGDDGDLEAGRDVDFFTLAENNVFGTTDRFTDELGGQTYTNNIVIDWSTFNGSTVLGWRKTVNGSNITWANAIDGALLVSIGTFTSGWRLPNIQELFSICIWNSGWRFNYSPFNIANSFNIWSSTTDPTSTSRAAVVWTNMIAGFSAQSKTTTTNMMYIPCRTFTVTGTTLS